MKTIQDQARRHLLARKAALAELERRTTANLAASRRDDEHDSEERSPAHDQDAAYAGLQAHERRELKEIDDALLRIERGEFGRCESCEGPIGRQRLAAVPEARFCIACSQEAEKRQSPRTGGGRL